LKCSVDLAYNNLFSRDWTNQQTTAFLKRECIADEFSRDLMKKATNARSIQDIQTGRSTDAPFVQSLILAQAAKHPDQYEPPKKPKSWDIQGGLSVYVDVLMHLLFLGIVKSTMKTLGVWMTKQGKHAEFHRHTEEFNKRLRPLHLDWLKCEEYRSTDKFGGWVSENFLGFSRILKWFFQNIKDLTGDVSVDMPPPAGKSFRQWNKPHLVQWLRLRGLKTTGTVVQLRERIQVLWDKPPPIVHTVAGEFIPQQVELMLVALEEMISSIMVSEVVPGKTVHKMEIKIKCFLTEFDLLDQQVKEIKDKPKVISSFNFLCLLNLPRLTERFGPLRNLWEGGFKGEGYIGRCKKWLRHGQKGNFETVAMTKILADMSLRQLSAGVMGKADVYSPRPDGKETTWAVHLGTQRHQFGVYMNRDKMVDILCQRDILSVVVYYCPRLNTTCVYGIMKCHNGSLATVRISKGMDRECAIEKMGCMYEQWYVTNDVMTSLQLAALSISPGDHHFSFAVLLPLLERGSAPKHTLVESKRYTVA